MPRIDKPQLGFVTLKPVTDRSVSGFTVDTNSDTDYTADVQAVEWNDEVTLNDISRWWAACPQLLARKGHVVCAGHGHPEHRREQLLAVATGRQRRAQLCWAVRALCRVRRRRPGRRKRGSAS